MERTGGENTTYFQYSTFCRVGAGAGCGAATGGAGDGSGGGALTSPDSRLGGTRTAGDLAVLAGIGAGRFGGGPDRGGSGAGAAGALVTGSGVGVARGGVGIE